MACFVETLCVMGPACAFQTHHKMLVLKGWQVGSGLFTDFVGMWLALLCFCTTAADPAEARKPLLPCPAVAPAAGQDLAGNS
jgi:hypothetical protein